MQLLTLSGRFTTRTSRVRETSAYLLREFPGRKVVRRLIAVLSDASHPANVRGTAAESLGSLGRFLAVPALLNALRDPEAEVRFWSRYALSQVSNPPAPFPSRQEIVTHIESLLDDSAPVQCWWTVRQEALGVLSWLDPPEKPYQKNVQLQCSEILSSGVTGAPDYQWAGTFML